jgi:hypothetical protein
MSYSHKLPPDIEEKIEAAAAARAQHKSAGSRQSRRKEDLDILQREIDRHNDHDPGAAANATKPKPSWRDTAVTAATLRTKTFQPIKFILPGLITEGVNLLVSRPKLGKSWMILDICLAAASNRFTLGDIKPVQGDVLYLALEDSERRLQSRIDKLLPTFGAEWPDRLTINTKWRRIDQGGIDDLKEWCDSVKKPVLVVVDVFAKVRPANSKSKQLYEADYEAVGMLQAFATERGIAVVLVHHDRKMEAHDPFDTVSGSHGITGAADTILIIKRTAAGITLYARGRDIEEAELAVQFNRNSCRWTILGQAVEVRRSDERSRVIEALKKAGGPLSAKDIMIRADLANRNATDLMLGKMAGDGEIERVDRGRYDLPAKDRKDRTDETDRTDPAPQSVRQKSSDRSTDRFTTVNRVDKSKEFPDLSNLSDLSARFSTGQIQPSELPGNLSERLPPQTDRTDSAVVPPLGQPGDSLDDFH